MAILAVALILLAPFVKFLDYQDYALLAPESLLAMAVLVAAALLLGSLAHFMGAMGKVAVFSLLLLLFIDIQFSPFHWWAGLRIPVALAGIVAVVWLLRQHLTTILATVFGTVMAGIVILPAAQEGDLMAAAGPSVSDHAPTVQPLVVHLLLDEHTGLAGIAPEDPGSEAIRRELREFFTRNGFRLFERAYAQHDRSIVSIPSILNFSAYAKDAFAPYVHDAEAYTLLRSDYFSHMADLGYRLQIFQSTFLDYCHAVPAATARCWTYRYEGLNALQGEALLATDKAALMMSAFTQLSFFLKELKLGYRTLREHAHARNIDLPPWRLGEDGQAPLPVRSVVQEVADASGRAGAGTLVFAHMLLPHFPYVFDRDCSMRPDPAEWSRRSEYDLSDPARDLARRLTLYDDQVRCGLKLLDAVFSAMRKAGSYDDAIIIVHGDHGSRIETTHGHESNKDRLTMRDMLQNYSTLYAVKAPHMAAGLDQRMLPVVDLLQASIAPNVRLREPAEPRVYLRRKNPGNAYEFALPRFPEYRS